MIAFTGSRMDGRGSYIGLLRNVSLVDIFLFWLLWIMVYSFHQHREIRRGITFLAKNNI